MFKKFRFHSQRGAMFGLDARIALATFGALAVLSGYMGFSKFTTANQAAFFKEVLAYEDAIEQMNTDLGVFYQFAVDDSDGENDFNAIEDGSLIDTKYRNRWNGPYIDGIRQDHPLYGDFTLIYKQENRTSNCNINNDCFVWMRLTDVPADIWTQFNKLIDENNGHDPEGTPISQGRVQSNNTADPRTLFFRTTVVRRTG